MSDEIGTGSDAGHAVGYLRGPKPAESHWHKVVRLAIAGGVGMEQALNDLVEAEVAKERARCAGVAKETIAWLSKLRGVKEGRVMAYDDCLGLLSDVARGIELPAGRKGGA